MGFLGYREQIFVGQIEMKRIFFGLLLSYISGVAQSSVLEIQDMSAISFSGYDGQPKVVTGAQSSGSWGSLFANTAGTFIATYLGNESGYTNGYSFGIGGTLQEANTLGTTISKEVGPGLLDFSFSDNAGGGHVFSNGQLQTGTLGFAIMNGQTNKYGTFDYLLGFNDSYAGDADYDDFVVGVRFVVSPVPEPKPWVIVLSGLVFLAYSARRRDEIS